MTTTDIIRELESLPLTEKLFVIEKTLRSIRKEKDKTLTSAVENLYQDYSANKELTIFTNLDKEPFYETR